MQQPFQDDKQRAPHRGGRGTVIVMVLITLTVATLLLSRFIERTTTELLIEARAAQEERLRADAFSALEVTLAVLADFRAAEGSLRTPAQGWEEPLAWAGYVPRGGVTVDVEVEDESGKLSLPHLDGTALRILGEILGLSPDDARHMADAILVWTRPDHIPTDIGSDPSHYERADPPHRPPQRPLRSFDELASIAGAREYFFDEDARPTELREEFARSVSLYSYAESNINAAEPVTLFLAGLDGRQVRQVIEFLAGRGPRSPGAPPYFRGMEDAVTLLGADASLIGLDATARCLRVAVTAREGATWFRLTAVVAPPGGATMAAVVPADPASPASDVPGPGGENSLSYPFSIFEIREETGPWTPPGGEA